MADTLKNEAPPSSSAAAGVKPRPIVPVVRQTLASKLRLLKVNPLLDREQLLKENNVVSRSVSRIADESTADKSSASVFQFSATPVPVAKKSNKENCKPAWRSSVFKVNKDKLKTGNSTLLYGKDRTKASSATYSSMNKATVTKDFKPAKQTTGLTSLNNQFKLPNTATTINKYVPQRSKNVPNKTSGNVLSIRKGFAAPLDKKQNRNGVTAACIQKQSSQHNMTNNTPARNLGAVSKNVKTVKINTAATYLQPRCSVTPMPSANKRKSILKKCVSHPDDLNSTYDADDKSLSIINGREAGHTPGRASIRRSVSFISPTEKYTWTPRDTVYAPEPNALRKNLVEWLKRRGKPATSFHHLHCFGLQKSDILKETKKLENKSKQILVENLTIPSSSQYVAKLSPISVNETDNSCKNLIDMPLDSSTPTNSPDKSNSTYRTPDGAYGPVPLASSPNTSDKENETPCKNKEKCALESLKDLLKLIKAGYSRSRCEQWLVLIRNSCPPVVETPLYWQCRAVLMEVLGQYFSAMSDYTTAIVKGAAPDDIGIALDQMLQKFGEINVKEEVDGKGNKYIDPANVFKSTIIQFALQMRRQSQKDRSGNEGNQSQNTENNSQLVMTPVRRSTRRSSSQYKDTTRVTIVNSIEDDRCKNVVFKPNLELEPDSSSKRKSGAKKKM